jgi:hypothetical protein
MQMQEEIRQHHDDAVSAIDRRRMPENALPNLRAANVVANRHRIAPIANRQKHQSPNS